MKQTIEYYYSLKIDKLYIDNNSYYFINDKDIYYFVFCNRNEKELEELFYCCEEMKSKNIYCHDFIFNNKGKLLTPVDDVFYILLKVLNKDEIYSIIDILNYNKKLKLNTKNSNLYRNNWAKLWESKIDYYENQLNEIQTNIIINQTIDYYIGLCENAIYYVNCIEEIYINNLEYNITLSHRRIFVPNCALNYLNPLNFIFDIEVRDVAEYIKSCFFANENPLLELQTYLKSTQLSYYSYNMLFARLLYPSYYFDVYDEIINKKGDEDKLLNIIKQNKDYEQFIKKAYKEISLYAPLLNVDWLIY